MIDAKWTVDAINRRVHCSVKTKRGETETYFTDSVFNAPRMSAFDFMVFIENQLAREIEQNAGDSDIPHKDHDNSASQAAATSQPKSA